MRRLLILPAVLLLILLPAAVLLTPPPKVQPTAPSSSMPPPAVQPAAVPPKVQPAAMPLAVPPLTGPCVDTADMLTSAERARVAARLEQVAQMTGGQMAVLTIRKLGMADSLESYSLRVAETWGLGHAGKDNGALLLIVRDDRLTRLEIGYGWEGAVNDARAGDLLRDLAPFLRAGRTADGILQTAARLETCIVGNHPPAPQPQPPQPRQTARHRDPFAASSLIPTSFLLPTVVISFALMMVFSPKFRRRVIKYLSDHSSGGGGFGSGSGSSGSGGGGSSGSGGGGFGGGGASGRW